MYTLETLCNCNSLEFILTLIDLFDKFVYYLQNKKGVCLYFYSKIIKASNRNSQFRFSFLFNVK